MSSSKTLSNLQLLDFSHLSSCTVKPFSPSAHHLWKVQAGPCQMLVFDMLMLLSFSWLFKVLTVRLASAARSLACYSERGRRFCWERIAKSVICAPFPHRVLKGETISISCRTMNVQELVAIARSGNPTADTQTFTVHSERNLSPFVKGLSLR